MYGTILKETKNMPKGYSKKEWEEEEVKRLCTRVASIPFLTKPIEFHSLLNNTDFYTEIVKEDCRGVFRGLDPRDVAMEIINYSYDIRDTIEKDILKYYVIQGD